MSEIRRLIVIAASLVTSAGCFAASKPDIENGKTTFTSMCGVCHSVEKNALPTPGPGLLGIMGRKAAADAEFPSYSAALKSSGIKWNKKTLNKFLANPGVMVQGTTMPMMIADDKSRADVVAYLGTLKAPKADKKKKK